METGDLTYDPGQDMAGLEDELAGLSSPGDGEPRVARLASLASGRPGAWPIGLALLAGVLLGWLVIGWWLWPVRWVGCAPQDLASVWQERYVALVAAELWRSGDGGQARAALAGWDSESLLALVATMGREATDPGAREQLSALRAAVLAAPERPEPPLWTSLLRQRAVFWSAGLAAILLAAALAVALAGPRLLSTPAGDEEGQGEAGSQPTAAGELAPWLEGLEHDEEEALSPAAGAHEDDDEATGQGSTLRPEGPTRARVDGSVQGNADGSAARTRVQEGVRERGEPSPKQAGRGRPRGRDARVGPEGYQEEDEEAAAAAVAAEAAAMVSHLLDDVRPADPCREALCRLTEAVSIDELERKLVEVMGEMRGLAGMAARRCAHDLRD